MLVLKRLRLALFSLGIVMIVLGIVWEPANAGEKIGNGGDVRRWRTQVSQMAIGVALGAATRDDACIRAVDHPEAPWVRGHAVELQRMNSYRSIEWVDEDQAACLELAPTPTIPNGVTYRMSYVNCPRRSQTGDYVRLIFGTMLRERGMAEPAVAARTDAFFAIHAAVERCLTIPAEVASDFAERRRAIPESALDDASLMRPHWERARVMAARWIRETPRATLEAYGTQANTYGRWMLDNRAKLALEVVRSPVKWESESRSCGFTLPAPLATIEVSIADCRELRRDEDLAWLLIHEASHHLGQEFEVPADLIASVFASGLKSWYEIP